MKNSMTNYKKLILSIIIVYFIIANSAFAIDENELIQMAGLRTTYEMEIMVYENEGIIEATQHIRWQNNTGKPQSGVFFHLYPNAFRRKETLPFTVSDAELAFPKGYTPSAIELTSTKVNNKQANYAFYDAAETIMHLDAPTANGEWLEIELRWTLLIPISTARFGITETEWKLTNFYPIIAVYEADEWRLDPYHAIGEPFYSDVAHYSLKVNLPKGWLLASSGEAKLNETVDDRNIWSVSAPSVRDVALVLMPKGRVAEKIVGDTTIKSYGTSNSNAKKGLDKACDAIAQFEEWFGNYPYPSLSVVECNFMFGGMEYPNLVIISDDYYSFWNMFNKIDYLDIVITHEIAHQWWYGMVGNDPIENPWLDEAITQYSTLAYMQSDSGKINTANYIMEQNQAAVNFTLPGGLTPLSPTYVFQSMSDYALAIYDRGSFAIDALSKSMDDGEFHKALSLYLQKNQFENATPDDFFAALKEQTGEEWQTFLVDYMTFLGRDYR